MWLTNWSEGSQCTGFGGHKQTILNQTSLSRIRYQKQAGPKHWNRWPTSPCLVKPLRPYNSYEIFSRCHLISLCRCSASLVVNSAQPHFQFSSTVPPTPKRAAYFNLLTWSIYINSSTNLSLSFCRSTPRNWLLSLNIVNQDCWRLLFDAKTPALEVDLGREVLPTVREIRLPHCTCRDRNFRTPIPIFFWGVAFGLCVLCCDFIIVISIEVRRAVGGPLTSSSTGHASA